MATVHQTGSRYHAPTVPLRILIIEDDVDLAGLLAADLRTYGFELECQPSAVQGLIAARERPPEAVILDLGLPDFDGHLVISRLRANTQVPILVLTAREATDEKVNVLELGANDYIVKPFHTRELVARLHVQLRRSAPQVVICGDLTLYPEEGRATFLGRRLPLTPIEVQILVLLGSEPDRIYSREELQTALWSGSTSAKNNLISVHMKNIRQKFEASGMPALLQTVWGQGYRLRTKTPG